MQYNNIFEIKKNKKDNNLKTQNLIHQPKLEFQIIKKFTNLK